MLSCNTSGEFIAVLIPVVVSSVVAQPLFAACLHYAEDNAIGKPDATLVQGEAIYALAHDAEALALNGAIRYFSTRKARKPTPRRGPPSLSALARAAPAGLFGPALRRTVWRPRVLPAILAILFFLPLRNTSIPSFAIAQLRNHCLREAIVYTSNVAASMRKGMTRGKAHDDAPRMAFPVFHVIMKLFTDSGTR
jgi:hypothetical protein